MPFLPVVLACTCVAGAIGPDPTPTPAPIAPTPPLDAATVFAPAAPARASGRSAISMSVRITTPACQAWLKLGGASPANKRRNHVRAEDDRENPAEQADIGR